MYKITAERELGIKTYWSTSQDIAKQIAMDLGARFNTDCKVQNMPEKRSWSSCDDAVKRIKLSDGSEMRCTSNEFDDAQAHLRGDIMKINAEEIFCFPAEDVVWQSAL